VDARHLYVASSLVATDNTETVDLQHKCYKILFVLKIRNATTKRTVIFMQKKK